MKFLGKGVIWDKDNNKPLAEFIKGEFITHDIRVINIIKELSYEYEEVEEEKDHEFIATLKAQELSAINVGIMRGEYEIEEKTPKKKR